MKKRVPLYFKIMVVVCIGLFGTAIWTLIDRINMLDPESEQVRELYSYLGDSVLEYCEGMPFYENETVSSDNMDETLKMCLAYKLIDEEKISDDALKKAKKEDACNFAKDKQFRLDQDNKNCSVNTLTVNDLNDAYFTLFGKNIEKHIDFNLSGSKTCYFDEKESRYVCGNAVVQTLQLGWAPTTFRMISKVKEKGNKIYLYDYYVAINNKKCYTTNSGNNENTKCSDKLAKDVDFNSKFVAKHGQKYLHIFEKDSSGNYHWSSSSIVD